MASILEQYRARAQAVQENNEGRNVESLVNRKSIKQDETTTDTNNGFEDEVTESVVAQEKLFDSIPKLVKLRAILINDPSLEASNPLVNTYLTVLKNQYGVSFEEESKESLVSRVTKKISDAFFAYRNISKKFSAKAFGTWGRLLRETGASLTFQRDVEEQYKDLAGFDEVQQTKLVRRLNCLDSKYVNESGKLVNMAKVIAYVSDFDKKIGNSIDKLMAGLTKELAKPIESKEAVDKVVMSLVKSSGLTGYTFNRPGLKIEFSVTNDSIGPTVIDKIEQAGLFSGRKHAVNVTYDEVKSWYKDASSNWNTYRKFTSSHDNHWKASADKASAEFEKLTKNGNLSDNHQELYIAVISIISSVTTHCKKALKYPVNLMINTHRLLEPRVLGTAKLMFQKKGE